MRDGVALLAYCHDHPDDDHAWLIYADWLEDHGDPARAEFIRIQLRRGGLWAGHPDDGPLAERERQLLDAHSERWKAHLPRDVRKKLSFRRGLPTHLGPNALSRNPGASSRRAVPIDSVSLSGMADAPAILNAGLLRGIRHFGHVQARMTREAASALAACADLSELRSLNLLNSV